MSHFINTGDVSETSVTQEGRPEGLDSHRLETEPFVALPPLSLPFRAAVDEAAAAAGSMFCEAMSANGSAPAEERQAGCYTDRAANSQLPPRQSTLSTLLATG